MKTLRFDEASVLNLKLTDASPGERVAALKELLLALHTPGEVDTAAMFEHGRVVVTVTLPVEEEWLMDYHIVWPDPQLTDPHLSLVKLVNWTASLKLDRTTAEIARGKAAQTLRAAIARVTGPGQPLAGRVALLGGGP